MPITEWVCRKCGTRFELLVLAGDEEEPVCDECGSKELDRQLSRFSSSGAPGGGSGASASSPSGCGPGRRFT